MNTIHFEQTWRWYGPNDVVTLADIKQTGATAVVHALHHFTPGEIWPIEAILERKQLIESFGLQWSVVESLPVSDSIKCRDEDVQIHIDNYKKSLANLAACGIGTITYNFMPILDWTRTHIAYELEDGSRALRFEKLAFIAFDIFILEREDARLDYTAREIDAASVYYQNMSDQEKAVITQSVLMGLPGAAGEMTLNDIKAGLCRYKQIDEKQLRENLYLFLDEIAPYVEELGIRLAIHPDDPPFQLLGIPRIMSTEADYEQLTARIAVKNCGFCFCTGSLSARAENDLSVMAQKYIDRIHFVHLRSTERDDDGNFYEANHLEGSIDMYSIMRSLIVGMQQRGESIPMRPDHGHQMLDDLQKNTYPGYSAIGRLKGLAELRGLEIGINRSIYAKE